MLIITVSRENVIKPGLLINCDKYIELMSTRRRIPIMQLHVKRQGTCAMPSSQCL